MKSEEKLLWQGVRPETERDFRKACSARAGEERDRAQHGRLRAAERRAGTHPAPGCCVSGRPRDRRPGCPTRPGPGHARSLAAREGQVEVQVR